LNKDYSFQTEFFINELRQLEQYLPLSNLFALLAVLSVFLILEGRNLGIDCKGLLQIAQCALFGFLLQ
jgi:hypothetical protein